MHGCEHPPRKVFTQVMGSDHNSFMREHVPGFFWDETGRADYNHTHHTQYDRLDQAIPEYLQQSATCAAVTAYNLACAPTLLARPRTRSGRSVVAAGVVVAAARRAAAPGQPTTPATPLPPQRPERRRALPPELQPGPTDRPTVE